MEILIALQEGKHVSELNAVKDLISGKPIKNDRSNLHGYLTSLELRGFVRRENQDIERKNKKGGPGRGAKWWINWDMWFVIRQELLRLRGDKTKIESEARMEAFWAEVENANQDAKKEIEYNARKEHYRMIEEANSKNG